MAALWVLGRVNLAFCLRADFPFLPNLFSPYIFLSCMKEMSWLTGRSCEPFFCACVTSIPGDRELPWMSPPEQRSCVWCGGRAVARPWDPPCVSPQGKILCGQIGLQCGLGLPPEFGIPYMPYLQTTALNTDSTATSVLWRSSSYPSFKSAISKWHNWAFYTSRAALLAANIFVLLLLNLVICCYFLYKLFYCSSFLPSQMSILLLNSIWAPEE